MNFQRDRIAEIIMRDIKINDLALKYKWNYTELNNQLRLIFTASDHIIEYFKAVENEK